jgi:Uma2 family endonuclease
MSVAFETAETKEMTAEEFLALPENGVSRELIRGELKMRGMTVRNRFHCRVEGNIVQKLKNWLDEQPRPRGEIVCGEAGFWLQGTKDSVVGIDVAYASAALVASTGPRDQVFHGSPLLAVEILSRSDTQEDIVEKVGLYTEAGVVVWVVDPDFQLVRIHRPGREPEALNRTHELSGDPELPGFRVAASAFFAD